MNVRIIEHSADAGRTWTEVENLHPRSVVAHFLMNADAYDVHDDGAGNLYRWRLAGDPA